LSELTIEHITDETQVESLLKLNISIRMETRKSLQQTTNGDAIDGMLNHKERTMNKQSGGE